ncbi:hypothetical protein [Streptomyces sp. NPDC058653]|uniref:hypothetical protein n=1 Tax=Streptomyces sp. NPDC058653 TaxID=3346576 RepID=UPI00366714EF
MSAPHTGHGIVSVLAGVPLAGTALAGTAVAGQAGPAPASVTAQSAQIRAAGMNRGRVIPPPGVQLRRTPNRDHPPIGLLPYGTVVDGIPPWCRAPHPTGSTLPG